MIAHLDLAARVGLGVGVVMMLQPWWTDGFRYGFFVTALFALLHILTSHLVEPPGDGD